MRRRTFWWLFAAFCGLLVFHAWLAARLPGPMLYEDTLGYLANARYLAGWGPQPQMNAPHSYYHFGYSLFLAPLYPILGSSWRVFRAALALDSLLASLQVFLLYALCRRLFNVPRHTACLIAITSALYPAWLLQSSFGWTESIFTFGFTLYVLLAYRAIRKQTVLWASAFSFTAAFLYTIHPRGLGIVAITFAFLAFWSWKRIIPRNAAFVAIAVCAVTFIITRIVNDILYETLWVVLPKATEGNLLRYLESPLTWIGPLPLRGLGQIWYLLTATAGVFAFGVWQLAGSARQRAPEPGRETARITLLAATAVLFESMTIMLPAFRSDHYVYGRYNEALLGPFLVAGLAMLTTATRRKIIAGFSVAIALFTVIGVAMMQLVPDNLSTPPMVLNIISALIWSRPGTLGMLRTTLGALMVTAAGAWLFTRSKPVALAALSVYFAAGTIVITQRSILPFCTYWRNIYQLQDTLQPLAPDAISYERSGLQKSYGFNNYQFWLGQTQFKLFDAAAGEVPAERYVIATRDWVPPPGYRIVSAEANEDQVLWRRD